MSPAVRKVIAFIQDNDIALVSYGLAPNPWGWCFEVSDNTPKSASRTLGRMLDGLSNKETKELRQWAF